MIEIRFAQKSDANDLKAIWKTCFGDEDQFIDFYFTNRFKENEVVVLTDTGNIAAMLTIVHSRLVTPQSQSYNAAMLYAIATHPDYRNKGCATQLMNFTNNYLSANNIIHTILVPADQHLFEFYHRQGYKDAFYIRVVVMTHEMIDQFVIPENNMLKIKIMGPEAYNGRRNRLLKGCLHIAYADKEIAYQKQLSQHSGADIYALDAEEAQGCAVIERVDSHRVIIKELLLPERFHQAAIRQISKLLPAEEYIVRTPAYKNDYAESSIQPFGVINIFGNNELGLNTQEFGYLGLAFD